MQKKGFAYLAISTAIFCGLVGAGYGLLIKPGEKLPTQLVPADDAVHPPEAEECEDRRHCPEESEVAKSIDDCRKLLDRGCLIIRGLKSSCKADRMLTEGQITDWQNEQRAWRAKNDQLLDWSELLLGADGTEVCPERPLALENLKRAGEWLKRSVDAAPLSQFDKSKIYLAGARKAINRARAVLSGKVRPDRRMGMLKTPSQIKILEKSERAKSSKESRSVEVLPLL